MVRAVRPTPRASSVQPPRTAFANVPPDEERFAGGLREAADERERGLLLLDRVDRVELLPLLPRFAVPLLLVVVEPPAMPSTVTGMTHQSHAPLAASRETFTSADTATTPYQ